MRTRFINWPFWIPMVFLTLYMSVVLYAQHSAIIFGSSLPATANVGGLFIKTGTAPGLYICLSTNTWTGPIPGTGAGDVTGPASSTDEAITRFDSTTGKVIQNSPVTLDDNGVFGFVDGIKQTFNPNGTNAGLNVGSQAGDPSSLANGDIWYDSTGNSLDARINGATVSLGAGGSGGKVAQVVTATTNTHATGSTQIPIDNTIPQNTEGDEYMTITITPTNASSTLLVEADVMAGFSTAGRYLAMALFRDSGADAIGVTSTGHGVTNGTNNLKIKIPVSAGSTSSTTFKIRIGANNSGTTTFNGAASGRLYGAIPTSTMTVTEILP